MTSIALGSNNGKISAELFGFACAQLIFNLSPDASAEHQIARDRIGYALATYFDQVMQRESERLADNPNQCDQDHDVEDIARTAIAELQDQSLDTEWQARLHDPEWSTSALMTVGSSLATAVSIERKWFADMHPENASAQTYKFKFHG